MAVEHRIVAAARLSPEERATLLGDLGKEGWSLVCLHEGAASWSRFFPTGCIVLEREVPAEGGSGPESMVGKSPNLD